MFLVAGLAVAGLVGIAAAFYFSIRSGNRGDKRLRSARAGRAVTDRRPGSRSGTARPDLTGHPRRAASGGGPTTTFTPAAVSSRNSRAKADTGPDPVLDVDQVLAGSRRAAPAATRSRRQAPSQDLRPGDAEAADSWPDDSWPGDSWTDDPTPEDPATTDPKLGPDDVAGRTAKPRRRVGFRKGADLDEELWPTETFGGVSDEQFWDDLASDKPLATTARTAQQDSPGKNRPPVGNRPPVSAPVTGLDTGPAADPQAVQAQADDRRRDNRVPGRGRREAGSGAYAAAPRTGPDPAAERTAIQPAYAATQPVQSVKSQLPGATQPVRVAASTSQPMNTSQPMSVVSGPGTGSQPREAGTQPTETRRRRPSSAEEDPLTSSAFSLRPSGPVDGRSSLRARNSTADQYDTSSPYPYPAPSYGDSSSGTQTMATPPYGQDYGYGRGDSAAQASEPRRHNGTRSHARPDSTGEGPRTARQASPRHSSQATGSYPGNAGYPGNGSGQGPGGYPGNGGQTGSYPVGGYPGNGHRGNGHRAPYDPRDGYRRLTPQH